MTWIDKTSMGREHKATRHNNSSVQDLPGFMCSLFANGVPVGIVEAWLKESDFTSSKKLDDSFKDFAKNHPQTPALTQTLS
jgi:hypothetical protein